MTFDDGILHIYDLVQVSNNTLKPEFRLSERAAFYFGFDVVGINRYYTAMRANVQIDAVVNIPDWDEVNPLCIVVLEDNKQYKIAQIQPMTDEYGLRITKLSLTRITENYEYAD